MGGNARIRVDSEPWKVGVVGAGILGLSTARALEDRGIECEVFEPGAPGGAQSRGQVHAVAFADPDPEVAGMKAESLKVWRRWEKELGIELFSQRGMVLFGGEAADTLRSPETLSGSGMIKVPGPELGTFLPTAGAAPDEALLDRTGGALWGQRTVGFLLKELDGPVIPREVSGIEVLPDGRAAITAGEIRREYDAAVVCAGASTKRLASGVGVSIPMAEATRGYATFHLRSGLAGRRLAGFTGGPDRDGCAHGAPMRDNLRYRVTLDREIESRAGQTFGPETTQELGRELDEWVETVMPGLEPHGVQLGLSRLARLSWDGAHRTGIGIWQQGPVLFPAGSPIFASAPRLGEILAGCAEGGPVPLKLRPEARFGAVPRAESPDRG